MNPLSLVFDNPLDDQADEWIRSDAWRSLSEDILGDQDLLALCASRSYPHPLGFSKIVLTRTDGLGPKIRLHYFPHEEGFVPSDVHGHFWDYTSRILAGGVKNVVYDESPEGEEWVKYRHLVADLNGQFEAKRVGPVNLRITKSREHHQGDVYSHLSFDAHRLETLDGPTVTLVVQGDYIDATNFMYRRPDASDESPRPVHMSPMQLEQALGDILRITQ